MNEVLQRLAYAPVGESTGAVWRRGLYTSIRPAKAPARPWGTAVLSIAEGLHPCIGEDVRF